MARVSCYFAPLSAPHLFHTKAKQTRSANKHKKKASFPLASVLFLLIFPQSSTFSSKYHPSFFFFFILLFLLFLVFLLFLLFFFRLKIDLNRFTNSKLFHHSANAMKLNAFAATTWLEAALCRPIFPQSGISSCVLHGMMGFTQTAPFLSVKRFLLRITNDR